MYTEIKELMYTGIKEWPLIGRGYIMELKVFTPAALRIRQSGSIVDELVSSRCVSNLLYKPH